jgi:uncharacterized protein YfaS (alpha-2-macroglobulin family)
MSTRTGPRIVLDFLLVSVVFVIAVLLIYQGIAMVISGEDLPELAARTADDTRADQDSAAGLRIRLSEGAARPDVEALPRPETETLSDQQVERLLETLPPLPAADDIARTVALTDEIRPPLLTGATVEAEFPPAEELAPPEQPEAGPLEVVRFAPEGRVERARELSITFNQPMVPVTSHEELAARDVPATLTPQPNGRWRWVGTRTLLFEVDEGFPMATEYSVEIPSGVRSGAGVELAEPIRWTFMTPPPELLNHHPSEGRPYDRRPVMFAEFDQRIDPDELMAHISVQAPGQGRIRVRRATPSEIEADEQVKALVARARDDRWVAFRASQPLPRNSGIDVVVDSGTPSAEGPITTDSAQIFDFRTYGPLRLARQQCGYGRCLPGTPLRIEFTNPLDEGAIDPSLVSVEPELANLRVVASQNWLTIAGRTQPRTDYRVTVGADLRDIFGQTLEEPAEVTFSIESFPKSLTSRAGDMVVLDPASPRELVVKSVNHRALAVRLYSVEPRHWSTFGQRNRYRDEGPYDPPGAFVHGEEIVIDAGPDEISETRIDLTPALVDGLGQVIAVIEPTEQSEDRWQRQEIITWVQVTRIGLSSIRSAGELIAWVTALDGAAPIQGVELSIAGGQLRRTTDADGLATLSVPANVEESKLVLVAQLGNDVALLPSAGWGTSVFRDRLAWYVFTDRPLYRPGEEVHFKGWVRQIESGPRGDMKLPDRMSRIRWSASDEWVNVVAEGVTAPNDLYGFDGSFTLPEDVTLGSVSISFDAPGIRGLDSSGGYHQIQVQEYRRPEYEVSVEHDGGPHVVGGAALVTAKAAYFAGGGLPESEVSWLVESRTAFFRPPNWDEFAFGQAPRWPWAYDQQVGHVTEFEGRTDVDGEHILRVDLLEAEPPVAMSLEATATIQDVNRQTWTESTSLLVHPSDLYVGLKSGRRFVRAGEPLVIEAIVVTRDGEAVEDREVELRAARTEWSWRRGEWRREELDAQDCRVTSRAELVRCEFDTPRGGAYLVTATVTDGEGRASLTELLVWASGGRGRWRRGEPIELIADRDEYRPGDTAEILIQSPFAAAEAVVNLRREGVFDVQTFRIDGPTHVLRVPILEEYTPNVHVHVDLIAARAEEGGLSPDPNQRASGSLNLSIPPYARTLQLAAAPRSDELKPGGETTVDIELLDAGGGPVADADVAVAVVDEAVLALLPQELQNPVEVFHPQRSAGAAEHQLRDNVLLGPRIDTTAVGAGGIDGTIRDGESGAPLAGVEVYLAGTDHRVLTGADGRFIIENVQPGIYTAVAELMGYGSGEDRIPIEAGASYEIDFVLEPEMYGRAGMRSVLFEEDAELAAPMAAMAPGEGEEAGGAQPGIRLRADFAAIAVFVGSARTDVRGRVEIPVRVPDNLTRYRVIAVAAGGAKQFGKGESTITAALPLMARPSAPRFLNFGDQFELPIVVQNRGAEAMTVDVAVRAANLRFTEGQGLRVDVPGGDRVEVRFPATTLQPGAVAVQVAAVAGSDADAAQIGLPVWTPATTEAFATYGELDEGAAAIQVAAPGDVIEEYGGLEVTTSSTALQALTDALLYLAAYPFECSEQLASRIIAIAALRDVLTAFEAEGLPEPEALVAAVDRDVERLQSMQNRDGGFSFWGDPREDSWPYVSVHVMHALYRAEQKGFEVPGQLVGPGRNYLMSIERRFPSFYSKEARRAIRAYALYTLNLMGEFRADEARAVIDDGGIDTLPIEAAGWLLAVLADRPEFEGDVAAIRRYLANRVSETAATAQFTAGYGDGDYLLLFSSRRADAVILDALIGDQPDNDVITKLVRGLLAHRTRGRWLNTQENAFVLLALDRYFSTYEKATPDFAARVWLGDDYAGGHEFRGRTTERHQVDVPMNWLSERGGEETLILGKDGPGRLYYRVGMRYAPADLKLDAAEHGFSVERTYQALDDPDDVRREEDGTWVIKAGARIRVKLSMAAPVRRYHVALVDPLPAGLEALNPELAGQETRVVRDDDYDQGYDDYYGGWRPWWRWYEHQNMRDERVEVFTSLLWPGVHSFSYLARATTPGTFVVPPPKAEEMYFPETFGRGASDRVVVTSNR